MKKSGRKLTIILAMLVLCALVGSASGYCTLSVYKKNADTNAALGSWEMKVWVKNPADGTWSRFTTGSNQCIKLTGAANGLAYFATPGCQLSAGTYKVVETQQSGWTPADPASGESGELVCDGSAALSVTFKNAPVTCTPPSITAQPEGKTKGVGESVTFSVSAVGTTPLTYQWRKDGAAITGATGSSYTISPLAKTDAGTYDVVVSNSCGSATSNGATLTVVAYCTIAGTKFDATTGDKLPGWEMKVYMKNGDGSWNRVTTGNLECVKSTGAEGVYSFNSPACLLTGPATYKVVETMQDGWSPVNPASGETGELFCPEDGATFYADFRNAPVICTAPSITAQPEGKTKGVGESVTFAVTAVGSETLTYQWRKDGAAITGATGSSYTISPLAKTDAGTYDVVVSNSCGSATSNGATLTVVAYCTIAGTKFDATTGDKLPGWEMKVYMKNGDGSWNRVTTGNLECIRLTGAEGGYSFNSPACLLTGPATYKVVETMQDGWSPVNPASGETGELFCPEDGAAFIRDFRNAPVPPCMAPSISSQPAGATKDVGQSATFSVSASGTEPLSYQWRKDGTPITSATGSSYIISSVVAGDAGSYDVIVSNSCGTATSDAATLTVNKLTPVITWENPADIQYGTELGDTQLDATSDVPGTFTFTPPAGTVLSAGPDQTLLAEFTPDDTGNYNGASADVKINVLKRPLTVTATGENKAYDGTVDTTVTLSTDALSGDTVTADYTGASFADKNVGTGKIVSVSGISIGGADAGNYNLASTSATTTADITAKAASVNPAAAGKTYGDADPALTGTLTGFLADDGVTATYSRTAGETAAGSPYTISATLSPAEVLGNYAITSNTADFTIAPASLTVKADDKTKKYSDPLPTFSVTYSGFVAGDTESVLGGTLSVTTTATQSSAPGTYPITPSGLTSPDYVIQFVDGTLTVNPASTTVAVSSSVNPSGPGQPVTFTATVTPADASGTVQFRIDGSDAGSPVPVSGGSASSAPVSTLTIGNHMVEAVYSGDTNYGGSSGTLTGGQTVTSTLTPTTTTLTSSVNPSVFGQPVTFTATVAPATATGKVTFRSKGKDLTTVTLTGGIAQITTSMLPVGTNPVQAVYINDSGYAASTSSALVQRVNKASTSTAVSSSGNPSVYGQPVTIRATVSVNNPGAGTPTGTVQFFEGTKSLGTAPVSAPTITLSKPTVGSHIITAVYSGDSNLAGSISIPLLQVVTKVPTTLTLTSSVNPSTPGQSVTFTAKVTPATATGKVTFMDWTTSVGSGTLTNGVAKFSTTSLKAGVHPITAVYGGDSISATSMSSPLVQTVKAR